MLSMLRSQAQIDINALFVIYSYVQTLETRSLLRKLTDKMVNINVLEVDQMDQITKVEKKQSAGRIYLATETFAIFQQKA